ncbi:MAG: dTDP-4-dehydrorhamnose 3,5-epimerase family protein [Lachnospiraceae bacterium]|nr:dTDP-4-dehydrorhamnose 3,5-epimerase family protein [Lachnospiraceae bacterium]
MNIQATSLTGVYLIAPDVHEDKRGNFYETYNQKEYFDAGLTADFIQDDISVSVRGVLKGMHGDAGTYKLVQCVYGSVYAVILNCDETSADFGKWQSFVLSAENKHQLYIPPMYGNGYYVLSDTAVYAYKQSTYYGDYPQFTYKWNDPRFNINWPDDTVIVSERDA